MDAEVRAAVKFQTPDVRSIRCARHVLRYLLCKTKFHSKTIAARRGGTVRRLEAASLVLPSVAG